MPAVHLRSTLATTACWPSSPATTAIYRTPGCSGTCSQTLALFGLGGSSRLSRTSPPSTTRGRPSSSRSWAYLSANRFSCPRTRTAYRPETKSSPIRCLRARDVTRRTGSPTRRPTSSGSARTNRKKSVPIREIRGPRRRTVVGAPPHMPARGVPAPLRGVRNREEMMPRSGGRGPPATDRRPSGPGRPPLAVAKACENRPRCSNLRSTPTNSPPSPPPP